MKTMDWQRGACAAVLACVIGAVTAAIGADAVYSGPQPGERATGFKVLEMTGADAGKERDPFADIGTAPAVLVFVHTIERSLVPLLRVIDGYGAERADRLKTEVIFLSADRLEGERRVRAAAGSLKLKSKVGLSVDGAEGPGNYGLNKDCMMTVLAIKDQRVSANFALVQPGIADAPKVIEALAKVCGDTTPPRAEELSARYLGGARMGDRAAAMRADGQTEGFPGAVPTDGKLNGLVRQFIRPTNDDAAVDRLMTEIREHIKGNADLSRQAADGWTRILHFGDRYGTAHARELARKHLEELKR